MRTIDLTAYRAELPDRGLRTCPVCGRLGLENRRLDGSRSFDHRFQIIGGVFEVIDHCEVEEEKK